MDGDASFGHWLTLRRKALRLSCAELARRVGCATVTLRKIEADERRPSRQIAAKLAEQLAVAAHDHETFISAARGERCVDRLPPPDLQPYPARPTRHSNLPAQTTTLIGREDEIKALAALLVTPACRLVSLVGPGGVGKTRVAIALAERLVTQSHPELPRFSDGIWFITLQAVDSVEQIVAAIIHAVRCPPPGSADPHDHLLAYLQPRQLLLVLDTFEHLREQAGLLMTILNQAPDVKLLVTSREALNLAAEWRYPLDGLPLPAAKSTHDSAQSDAVRLFVERAQRVRPQFNLADERAAVLRICRLVEGIPLAIELAATWSSALSCAAIADEISGNLTFLTSGSPHVSERHRSMRAVFDASWSLLSQDERAVFARLSVFRSGFQYPAAAHVAGAQLATLMVLVDKSLLRWEPGDRYRIHELLRQYRPSASNSWMARPPAHVSATAPTMPTLSRGAQMMSWADASARRCWRSLPSWRMCAPPGIMRSSIGVLPRSSGRPTRSTCSTTTVVAIRRGPSCLPRPCACSTSARQHRWSAQR